MRRILRHAIASAAFLLISLGPARAQSLSSCYAGFDLPQSCITARGLDLKLAVFQRKIAEAMPRLGASYKFDVRVVNNPVEAGYDAERTGDVFTEVLRGEDMQSQSFITNVTADFLEKQPEILFESSALHEVCHVMNDDLTGYHRNGANIEVAEEHCVLQVIGESRYEEFLTAYAKYQRFEPAWDNSKYQAFLQKVKDVALVPAACETDEADRFAAEYFRKHADGKEHLLAYNGEFYDQTLSSTRNKVQHNPEKLMAVIKAGKPVVFFHNHPAEDGRAAMFPSYDDFGVAALFSSLVYGENPSLPIEFRVMQAGKETTIVSYGFKGTAVEEIKKIAAEFRNAVALKQDVAPIEMRRNLLVNRLAQESFSGYLQYACPVDLARKDAEVCRTHPQYFIWPSDRFFVHNRPQ